MQNAVFNEHIAGAGMAFVVDIERAAPIGQRAVIEHRDPLGGHPLTDAPGKSTRALAVEIALQAMAHRLVQQDTGPARAEHHRHLAGRSRTRLEIGQGRLHRLVDILAHQRVVKIGQPKTPTAAGRADLAATFLLGNDRQAQADQRPHVRSERAIGARHQDHVVLHGQAGHHLHDAPVLGLGQALDLLEQGHLGGAVERGDRIDTSVERAAGRHFDARRCSSLDPALGPRRRDGAHRARGIEQAGPGDVVGVGKGGFLATDCAHTDPLVDAKGARFDNALFQAPAFAARVLKVQIGIVGAARADLGQSPAQMAALKPKRREQELLGNAKALAGAHRAGQIAQGCVG